jgi:hypothetical protein
MEARYRGATSIAVDIGHLPAGLYFVSVDNAKGKLPAVMKFIKK